VANSRRRFSHQAIVGKKGTRATNSDTADCPPQSITESPRKKRKKKKKKKYAEKARHVENSGKISEKKGGERRKEAIDTPGTSMISWRDELTKEKGKRSQQNPSVLNDQAVTKGKKKGEGGKRRPLRANTNKVARKREREGGTKSLPLLKYCAEEKKKKRRGEKRKRGAAINPHLHHR